MFYEKTVFNGEEFGLINKIMENELNVFNDNLNLIGSGSYTFKNVLRALGTPMALNPAEGFPGKRYFPSCENLDELELVGNKLALDFFNSSLEEYKVSLQPHSGTQANHIIFNSLYQKDERRSIISMSSESGGHVSHNFYPATFFKLVNYQPDDNGDIDYDYIDKLCEENSPMLLIGGASSYPKEINYKRLASICKKYNILLLADISHTAVLIANGVHQTPFGYADFVTMTTNKGTRGPRGGIVFYKIAHQKKIERSIFPLTQGSPKYNEILSKVVMFMELERMDFKGYVNKIISFSKLMANYFISQGCKIYTNGTESHLVVLDLSECLFSGKEAENKLIKINILANRNMIPNDKRSPLETSGVRFGTVCPACLDMSEEHFIIIIKSIYDCLFYDDYSSGNIIKNILKQYTLEN